MVIYSDYPANNFFVYILYPYINVTSQMQIIRMKNIPSYYWERVIFPGQQLIFEAMTSALLEIYTSDAIAIPTDVIPCEQLRVIDKSSSQTPALTILSW